MIEFGIDAARAAERIDRIVVVRPPGTDPEVDRVLARMAITDGGAGDVVDGGATRQGSVSAGLAAVPRDTTIVVVHDAARPFATPGLFDDVVEALTSGSPMDGPAGAVPVLPCADTIKRVRDGAVVETIDRSDLVLVQTPQAFLAAALRDAHSRAERVALHGTDDAVLLEAAGYHVVTVAGEPANFKITTREDLARAEAYAAATRI